MIYNFDGPGLQCFKVSYKEVMRGFENVLIQSNLFEKSCICHVRYGYWSIATKYFKHLTLN